MAYLVIYIFFFFLFFVLVFIFENEKESAPLSKQGRGRKREREVDTESKADSRLWAVSTEPHVGLELTDGKIMTCAEVGCLTAWATQAPHTPYLLSTQISQKTGIGSECGQFEDET